MAEPQPIPVTGSAPFHGMNGTNGTNAAVNTGGGHHRNTSNSLNGTAVIDLRDAPATRVRVERDNNPFSRLSKPERMKLIIRVLCEIVAYGETDEDTDLLADGPIS